MNKLLVMRDGRVVLDTGKTTDYIRSIQTPDDLRSIQEDSAILIVAIGDGGATVHKNELDFTHRKATSWLDVIGRSIKAQSAKEGLELTITIPINQDDAVVIYTNEEDGCHPNELVVKTKADTIDLALAQALDHLRNWLF